MRLGERIPKGHGWDCLVVKGSVGQHLCQIHLNHAIYIRVPSDRIVTYPYSSHSMGWLQMYTKANNKKLKSV